jgi:hypothetical protein
MPKRLESPIYLTFTSITMPFNSILEDMKQRATIARLKLVVQSLDQNLAKPHKSIAEHSIRYDQLTEDHQERATFFRSLQRVVQDMLEIEDRAKTILAASLVEFANLGSNSDQRLTIERNELGRKLASLKSDLEDQRRAESMAAMGNTMGRMLEPFLMDE